MSSAALSASARRRATELARRAGVRPRELRADDLGPVLALAYPDRIAQRRSRGRVRMRAGGGAWIPATDPLADEDLLVVASLDAADGDARVRLAAALDPADGSWLYWVTTDIDARTTEFATTYDQFLVLKKKFQANAG